MTSGGQPQRAGTGLLGVEIGRNRVRLVLLDERASQLVDAVERPIAKAGGPRDPIEQEFSTRSAIEAGLDRLDIAELTQLPVGATIGFPNCGVGSGPALQDWLESLSDELDEPVLYTGRSGISYAPASCVDFVQRVFEPIGLQLNRIELAPVAAARVLTSVRSGAISLGSGVAWSARLLNNQVLEAFETVDGGFDDELQVVINGVGQLVDRLDGFEIDDSFALNRGLSPAALAPAVGVAVGLLDPEGPNLLVGNQAGAKVDVAAERSMAYGASAGAGAAPHADSWPAPSPVPEPDVALSEPLPAGPHLEPDLEEPFDQPLDLPVDDLGTIQDALRAHRADDTYQLRRLPRSIERSRELRSPPPGRHPSSAGELGQVAPDSGFDPIEAFAHPDHLAEREGFHVSDFLLGALLMLAIVLAAALVLL
ncbi:MAG: hypothetical protein OEV40_23340 [Acidimicrobiia bacterium]|nr:hypothetical protein [Acidimicrobiia bacterium]